MTGDRAAHESESRFRALAEASPAAIFIVQDGRFSYVNPTLASIAEYDRDALIGVDPIDLLHPADRAALSGRQSAHVRGVVRIRTSTGQVRWIDLTTAPFAYEGGGDGVIGTGIDITDRKHLEDRMERRHQLEAVGRLAGGVAHDFNNLLLVISGEAERILDGLPPEHALRASAHAVTKAARRAAELTEGLMAFGRQQTLLAQPLNLNEVIVDLREEMQKGLGEDISLTAQLAAQLPPARFDRTRLEQILLSLVANAREALAGAGTITVTTDVVEVDEAMREVRPWLAAGTWVRLQVADTGRGIAPDVLPRVFEPFFTTKRSGGGTGMGLSTVYGIVKQSDGYVWVDSAPGAGTCVTILLPPADAAEQVPAAAAPPPVARGHVFLVEDEEGVRDLLATVLRNAGFTVSVASSAEMALDMAPHVTFDLLLTDVVLPGITGPELARRVRESVPGMRVLFMSGYTGDALRDHADLGDVGGFIQKPFATKVLVEQVRQMLETGGRNSDPS